MRRKTKAQVTRKVPVKKKRAGAAAIPQVNLPNVNWRLITLASIFLVPLLAFIYVYQWIQKPENLTIKSVEVQGELKHLDKNTLRPIIEPFAQTNLFLLDQKSLEEEVEFNPWVHSASLTSIWPDKVIVKIHEQKPIAFWGSDGMINEFGDVIDVDVPSQRGKLPMLYSPFDKGREMVQNYVKLRNWLKDFPVDVVAFTEDSRGSWQLKLANGLKVNIGRQEQERRLRRFVVGYRNQLVGQVEKIDTVDLRYTNGFSVKWNKGA